MYAFVANRQSQSHQSFLLYIFFWQKMPPMGSSLNLTIPSTPNWCVWWVGNYGTIYRLIYCLVFFKFFERILRADIIFFAKVAVPLEIALMIMKRSRLNGAGVKGNAIAQHLSHSTRLAALRMNELVEQWRATRTFRWNKWKNMKQNRALR